MDDLDPRLPRSGELIHGHNRIRRYRVVDLLGKGGFGAVFEVREETSSKEGIKEDKPEINTGEPPSKTNRYAMKCEVMSNKSHVLKMDLAILRELTKHGGRHFCFVHDRSRTDTFNFIIMTLVGQNLHDLKNAYPGHHFTVGTALRVAIQTLESIEDFHMVAYLHRDIKPGNFAVGSKRIKEELRKIYILDFGLARQYKHDNGELRRPRKKAGFRGTVRYASLSSHNEEDLGRKDDLESWFYMVVELTCGAIPWRDCTSKQKGEVREMKEYCRERRGCREMLRACPRNYERILTYIDTLEFWSIPDYAYIYELLRRALKRAGVAETDLYDWEEGGSHHEATERLPMPRVMPNREAPTGSEEAKLADNANPPPDQQAL